MKPENKLDQCQTIRNWENEGWTVTSSSKSPLWPFYHHKGIVPIAVKHVSKSCGFCSTFHNFERKEMTDKDQIEGVFKEIIDEQDQLRTTCYAVLVGIDPGRGQTPVFDFPRTQAECLGAIIQGINARLRMLEKKGPKIVIRLEAR